jgi:hypothetical protein
MMEKHGDSECGCGGLCKWGSASKEEKIALLEKKEAKLQKMLSHIQKVKEAVASGQEVKPDSGEEAS